MQRTLIAVFDNHASAQAAIEELVSAGFSRPQIRLSEGDPTGGASPITGDDAPATPRATTHGNGSFADGIKNFLSTIFGTDDSEHVQAYSDAVTRGHHVLTLTAADESEAERASDIVERFSPVDIDERAAQWSGGALAGDAMAGAASARQPLQQQNTASMSQQSLQGGAAQLQGGQGEASRQRAAATPTPAPAPGDASQQRSGVKVFTHDPVATLNETAVAIEADEAETGAAGGGRAAGPANAGSAQGGAIQRPEHEAAATLNETEAAIEADEADTGAGGGGRAAGPATQAAGGSMLNDTDSAIDDDETYYRGHYNSNFASSGKDYGHYAPAYRYGKSMAGEAQYRDLPWTDVNQELRRDWEGRNPGAAWDQFEASVRYGWERRGS